MPHLRPRAARLKAIKKMVERRVEKAMAPHSSTLAWKIPWVEEPGRLQSMGSLGMGEPGGVPSMGSHGVGHD